MRIKDMHRDLLRVLNEQVAALETFHARLMSLETGMAEWRPQVHLTDEQLDKVLALREPLSIPQHAAEQVATLATYNSITTWQQLSGYGGGYIAADWTLKPDGSMQLVLADHTGAPFWRGTFRGPDV
jgi:hypothetical protein